MRTRPREMGFSLIEFFVGMLVFTIISSAIFGLLNVAQIRYRSEQQKLEALQGARIGIDQLTRDIHRAGYPPQNSYQGSVSSTLYAIPFVGMVSGVINQNCTVNGGATACSIPGPYDLVIETQDGGQVNWIYYQLRLPSSGSTTCTLYRAVNPKTTTGVPIATSGTPLAEQVINMADGTCNLSTGQPVFSYVCEQASPCNPQQILQVVVQVQAVPLQPDLQTRQLDALTLRSVARRLNPRQ